MKLLKFLCRIGLHSWGHEVEAKRYHHNKPFDKTKNMLGPAKPLAQKCGRCGRRRVWSFRRGCWRPAGAAEDNAYEVAVLDSVGPLAEMDDSSTAPDPVSGPAEPSEPPEDSPNELADIAPAATRVKSAS